MKEKKILIVALLGMAFQVQAGRSVLRDDSDSDTQEAPKKETKKKHKTHDASDKKGRNALHERMTREEDEHARGEKKHTERRAAERDRKHEAYEERKDKADHKKGAKDVRHSGKKGAEPVQHEHKENLQAAERRDDARLKAEEKREQSLKKRRDAADKKVSRLENKLDKLEDKHREEMDKRHDTEERVIPSHLINKTDGTRDLEKDITNVKERLKTREEQARKLSDEYKNENREEYETRTILGKVYANEQRDLRRQLANVKDALAMLRIKEKKEGLALAEDRDAYEAVHRDMRARRAVKDTAGVHKGEKKVGIRPSDNKVALEKELERLRQELESLRMKVSDNDKAIDVAAHRAGLEPRKEQKRKADLDHYIKEDRENDTRLFSEKRRQIDNRREDIAYQRDKAEKMNKKSMAKKAPMKKKMEKKA